MNDCKRIGFPPGRALVSIDISSDAHLELREWNGKNVVWLNAPLRCDAEWGLAHHVAKVLNAIEGKTAAWRIAETIDSSSKNGPHAVVIYAHTESALTDPQIMAAVAGFFRRVVPQSGIGDGELPAPADAHMETIESHAIEFMQHLGNKNIPRPMLVRVGSEVVADVRGRWASGAPVDDPPAEEVKMLAHFDGLIYSKRIMLLLMKRRSVELCFDPEDLSIDLPQLCENFGRLYVVLVVRKVVNGKETLHLVRMKEATQEDLETPLETYA